MKKKWLVYLLGVLVVIAIGYSVANIKRTIPANVEVVHNQTQVVQDDTSWLYKETEVQETPSTPTIEPSSTTSPSTPVETEQTESTEPDITEEPETEPNSETEFEADEGDSDGAFDPANYATFEQYAYEAIAGVFSGDLFDVTNETRLAIRDLCFTENFISNYSQFIDENDFLLRIKYSIRDLLQPYPEYDVDMDDYTFTVTFQDEEKTYKCNLVDGKIDSIEEM